ncbi:MAG: helix-turn-helix domain-containing protein [Rhodomicrobium sp.]
MPAERFKAIRRSLGWSASRMGKAMGVDGRSVFRWENGERAIEGPAAVLAALIEQEGSVLFEKVKGC